MQKLKTKPFFFFFFLNEKRFYSTHAIAKIADVKSMNHLYVSTLPPTDGANAERVRRSLGILLRSSLQEISTVTAF